jgi:hypothetical protein
MCNGKMCGAGAHHCPLHRLRDVDVVEHYQRRLAAELERARRQVRRGGGRDGAPRRAAAGERELADASVRGERRARGGAGAGDDVEHASGHFGIARELREQHAHHARVLRPVQHDGAPCTCST